MRQILFTAIVANWRDRVYGNTYCSVRCIRHSDGSITTVTRTACGSERLLLLEAMQNAGWISSPDGNLYAYERENNYPILWVEKWGTKKECEQNGNPEI